jgi:DNA repair protein RecO (recombination protein O)
MVESATGLVLRTRRLTESSLIVHWLTAELGRVPTVAKGALRPKSPFHGKLDLFYLADFNFARSRRSELHTLREVSLRQTHPSLRHDLASLQTACYCAALVEQVTEADTPLPGIFELMTSLLAHLPGQDTPAQTVFAFELKLLEQSGLQPDLEKARLSAGSREVATALTRSNWTLLNRLKLADSQVKELDRFLHGFLIYHLGKIPKGRNHVVTQPTG